MSRYLCQKITDKIKLDSDTLVLLTKGLNTMSRKERKILYGSSSEQIIQVKLILTEIWQSAEEIEKREWLVETAESIIEKNGDRDFIDKFAAHLIGPLKVYHLVRKLCDERCIFLKTSSSQGGCAVALILITFILATVLILNYI